MNTDQTKDGEPVRLLTSAATTAVQLTVNGRAITVSPGTVLAAAIAAAGVTQFRRSVSGQPRLPVCGMGVCMECRVTVNGQSQRRSCQTLCEPGMEVRTDE